MQGGAVAVTSVNTPSAAKPTDTSSSRGGPPAVDQVAAAPPLWLPVQRQAAGERFVFRKVKLPTLAVTVARYSNCGAAK